MNRRPRERLTKAGLLAAEAPASREPGLDHTSRERIPILPRLGREEGGGETVTVYRVERTVTLPVLRVVLADDRSKGHTRDVAKLGETPAQRLLYQSDTLGVGVEVLLQRRADRVGRRRRRRGAPAELDLPRRGRFESG